jgi:hypothetical protein
MKHGLRHKESVISAAGPMVASQPVLETIWTKLGMMVDTEILKNVKKGNKITKWKQTRLATCFHVDILLGLQLVDPEDGGDLFFSETSVDFQRIRRRYVPEDSASICVISLVGDNIPVNATLFQQVVFVETQCFDTYVPSSGPVF